MAAAFYSHSAGLFDLRYSQKNYESEAAMLSRLLDRIQPGGTTLLDVACGTGSHLAHLRGRYDVEGIDRNRDLLGIARERLGDVPLHEGEMTGFDLGRSFDVVTCFFAAVACLSSVDQLRAAMSCMAAHVADDGILFVEPYLTPSAYRENEVVHNFRRAPDTAVSWMYVMRRDGPVAIWDIHWLVGTPDAGVTHFVEREEMYLFTTDECAAAIRDAGLHVCHHPHGLHGYGAFLGRKGRPWSADDLAAIREALPARGD
jgi:SAM-dependent methyltransferase